MTASRIDLRKPPQAMAAVTLLVLAATVIVLVIWSRLEAIRPSTECLAAWLRSVEGTGACASSVGPWQDRREEWLLVIIRLAAILAGLGLGAVVGWSAGRRGDAGGTWRPWVTRRLLPAVVLLIGSLAVFAAAATAYQAALEVQAREAVLLGALALITLCPAVLVVARRRLLSNPTAVSRDRA